MAYFSHKPLIYRQLPFLPSSPVVILDTREIDGITHTGAIFKVRRSSDGVEADFYQGASPNTLNTTRGGGGTDISTWLAGSGATVSRWYYLNNSGNYASFGTVSRQPIIATSGTVETINGKIALKYVQGSATTMTLSSQISAAENWTAAVVCKRAASGQRIFGICGGFYAYTIIQDTDNVFYIRSRSGYLSTSADTSTAQMIAVTTMAGTTRQMRKNGASVSTTFTSSPNSASFKEAGSWDDAGYYGSYHLQSLFLWSSDQSANSTAIETIQNDYYGIY